MIFLSNLSLIVGLVRSYVIFDSKLVFLHEFCIFDSKYPFSTNKITTRISQLFLHFYNLTPVTHNVTHRDDYGDLP